MLHRTIFQQRLNNALQIPHPMDVMITHEVPIERR